MDVDAAMATEPDHEPAATANGGDHPTESDPSSSHQLQSSNSDDVNDSISSGGGGGAGVRCSPTYTVVTAVMDKKEDGPGPRCGHTLTAVPAVGEEGSPGYIGPRLILFGGATALEGNSGASGTPSSAGSAGIRMCCLNS